MLAKCSMEMLLCSSFVRGVDWALPYKRLWQVLPMYGMMKIASMLWMMARR
jgi:hypothetical protein